MEMTTTPAAELQRIAATRIARGDVAEAELLPLLNTVANAERVILAAQHDSSLSDAGRKYLIEQTLAKSEADVVTFETGTRRFSERVAVDMQKALSTPTVDDARAVEIRAWASGKAASERAAIYLRAVDDRDHETVSAFESAPRAFGLLDAVTRERAEARKLAALDAGTRAALEAAQLRLATYGHMTDATRRALRLLAGR